MPGTISWFEVLGRDGDKLRSFYGELFDWKFQTAPDMQGYGTVDPEQSKLPGGVGAAAEGTGWSTFYVHVEDVEQSIEQALASGGKLLMPVTRLPEATIAVIADPVGPPVGLTPDP